MSNAALIDLLTVGISDKNKRLVSYRHNVDIIIRLLIFVLAFIPFGVILSSSCSFFVHKVILVLEQTVKSNKSISISLSVHITLSLSLELLKN